MSEQDDCRVYWGHSGCSLLHGHDADQPIRVHRHHIDGHPETVETAFMFGEDLTEAERARTAELWD